MSVSIDEVRHIARLARLSFNENEERKLAEEMSKILSYMETLNELDTDAIPPMAHVLDASNVYRVDEAKARISHEEALSNAPDHDGEFFRVPKVIE
jgi:aspartyl-tRNA(Asn)/glutamyl-tRNA(Gln) amidotransferase subunit C